MDNMISPVLMEIVSVKRYFPVRGGILLRQNSVVKAVDGVSLSIHEGETLALVGESGCGKSTLGRLMVRLDTPTAGTVLFAGENVQTYAGKSLKNYRKQVQLIFQDPYASLNPRRSAGYIIEEPLIIHESTSARERRLSVAELMKTVGLSEEQMRRYPHEFSGGQRQRIGIARAIALKPKLIVADEPVSALDVSIQAQILNLLKDLQVQFGLTYLFITHDLSVVHYLSDRVAVMYLGKIVELAGNDDLFENPLHPYTQALLSAVPVTGPQRFRDRIILTGDIPSPLDPPLGCAFHPRCPYRFDPCDKIEPCLENQDQNRQVACHMIKSA
ncbi:MAG: dipeptide ABC transporter ATP-binding protein, partial [Deltaproteobacteria bacterium]|nr:dipeptide ABC transporter ATP-binding protein [Deltaproteobacteria bacterium]